MTRSPLSISNAIWAESRKSLRWHRLKALIAETLAYVVAGIVFMALVKVWVVVDQAVNR